MSAHHPEQRTRSPPQPSSHRPGTPAALALLLPLNQWELDLHHPTKLLLGVELDVEHAGAIYLTATRLGGVAFAGWSSR